MYVCVRTVDELKLLEGDLYSTIAQGKADQEECCKNMDKGLVRYISWV